MLATLITLAMVAPPIEEPDWIGLFLEGSRALERGELHEAQCALERALDLQPGHAPIAWQLASAMARSGETSGALDQLETIVTRGGGEAALLEWDPDLASRRREARFGALLERLETRERTSPPLELPVARLTVSGGGRILSASPGAEVATTLARGQYALRDLRAGETLVMLERPGELLCGVAMSPDGRWAVTDSARRGRGSNRHYLRVFDAVTGDLVTELAAVGYGAKLQFSHGGTRMMAEGGSLDSCVVWATESWRPIAMPSVDADQALLSPDGTRILFLSRSGKGLSELVFWDVDEHRCLARHQKLATVPNTRWEFSAGGSFAVVVENMGGGLRLYDGFDGAELKRIEPGEDRFTHACFLGETAELVSIDRDRLRVWNARTGDPLRTLATLEGGGEAAGHLDAAPDGSRVLVSGLGLASPTAFDPDTGEIAWTAASSPEKPDDELWRACYTSDGSRVFALQSGSSHDGVVIDARSGEQLSTTGEQEQRGIVRAHPRRDELWVGREDGGLLRLDATRGRVQGRWRHGIAAILGLCFSREGDRLVTLDRAGVLRVIETTGGEVVAAIANPVPSDPTWSTPHLRFSPEGSALLVAESSTELRIHDTSDWSLRCEIEVERGVPQWSWRPDGRVLATGAEEGRVWLYDTNTGFRLPVEIDIDSDVFALAFEPHGDRLWVGGSESRVHVFDVESGTEVHTLEMPHHDPIFEHVWLGTITFREDGALAITASAGYGVVAAWDPASGRQLWEYGYEGGNGSELCSAFDRSGERVYVWGQGFWTPRIVSAEDGSTLLDLADRRFRELVPLPGGERLAVSALEGVEVIETDRGTSRWTRFELAGDGWLLAAATHHVDGTRRGLEEMHLCLPERSYPLDALASALLDPKKVRAAAEGVLQAPARLPALPALLWEVKPPRVVRLTEEKEPPAVTLVARCSEGLAGFELLRDGERQLLAGEVVSPTRRHLTFQLERPARGKSIDYRWRSIGEKGVLSRALHLTVELER